MPNTVVSFLAIFPRIIANFGGMDDERRWGRKCRLSVSRRSVPLLPPYPMLPIGFSRWDSSASPPFRALHSLTEKSSHLEESRNSSSPLRRRPLFSVMLSLRSMTPRKGWRSKRHDRCPLVTPFWLRLRHAKSLRLNSYGFIKPL
jgi:hypothetical protein